MARRAPILMLSVVRLNDGSNGARNLTPFATPGTRSQTLFFARGMGLASEQMAGFDSVKAREQFKIPSGFEPTAAIALGYPSDLRHLPIVESEGSGGTDRPFESFVFTGSWGQPSPLISEAMLREQPRIRSRSGEVLKRLIGRATGISTILQYPIERGQARTCGTEREENEKDFETQNTSWRGDRFDPGSSVCCFWSIEGKGYGPGCRGS